MDLTLFFVEKKLFTKLSKKERKFYIKYLNSIGDANYKLINKLKWIDTKKYGDCNEIHDTINNDLNEKLVPRVIRSRTQNIGIHLYRVLYILKWSIKLNLPKGWDRINYDISSIIKNKDKQLIHNTLMKKCFDVIHKTIAFRETYYEQLNREIVVNEVDLKFLEGFNNLWNNFIDHAEYCNNHLDKFSKKELNKIAEKYEELMPTIDVNLSCNIESIYNKDPNINSFNIHSIF